MAVDPQVRRIMGNLDKFVSRLIALITIEITNELIVSTPVKTGWARANWLPAIGAPANLPVGSQENVTTGPQKLGIASLQLYSLKRGQVYITNNVPYIGLLNAGSSRQAPPGFVQTAISKGLATGAKAARGLSR